MGDDQKKLVQQVLLQQIELLLETRDTKMLLELLDQQRSSDIAEVISLLDDDEIRSVFDLLDNEAASEVFEKVEEATRSELFEILSQEEIKNIISELDADEAADILQELDKEESAKLLQAIPLADSREIRELMKYSEDSAGGIMDPVVLSVTEDATVAEAINKIRSAEIDEDFYSVFVVDEDNKFVGDVRIRLLLTSPEGKKIKELTDVDTIYVDTETDQEHIRNVFRNNDLIVVPVLDDDHKLVGRITADIILEVAEEEAAEDIYAMAGTEPEELEDVSVIHAARIRLTWLMPCLVGTAVTAVLLMFFESIEKPVFLAAYAFVPMIAAISGNAGLQTSAIVVSRLASGHLAAQKLKQVFQREVRIALVIALSCGLIGAVLCAAIPSVIGKSKAEVRPELINLENTANQAAEASNEDGSGVIKHIRIVFAFGFGMFSAIMVATTLGLFLPFLFRKVGIDPAISSGPLVTTANDSISVTIYMLLAILLA